VIRAAGKGGINPEDARIRTKQGIIRGDIETKADISRLNNLSLIQRFKNYINLLTVSYIKDIVVVIRRKL
jgi:hypothetical protein